MDGLLGSGVRSAPFESAYSCQPSVPRTSVPSGNRALRDCSTTPIVMPRITAPMAIGGRYVAVSFIQPRLVGSSDRYRLWTRTSPSPGVGAGSSLHSKSDSLTAPIGRAASLHWRLTLVLILSASFVG